MIGVFVGITNPHTMASHLLAKPLATYIGPGDGPESMVLYVGQTGNDIPNINDWLNPANWQTADGGSADSVQFQVDVSETALNVPFEHYQSVAVFVFVGTESLPFLIAQQVVHVAPVASGALPDVNWTLNAPIAPVDISGDFTGLELFFQMDAPIPGIAIDSQTGIISGTPIGSAGTVLIQVTAVNSGGQVVSAFNATLTAASISAATAPAMSRLFDGQSVDDVTDYATMVSEANFTSSVGTVRAQDVTVTFTDDATAADAALALDDTAGFVVTVTDDQGSGPFTFTADPIVVEYDVQVISLNNNTADVQVNDLVPDGYDITLDLTSSTHPQYNGEYLVNSTGLRGSDPYPIPGTSAITYSGALVDLTVGDTLTAQPPIATTINTSVSVTAWQWKRDGVDVSGANSENYALTNADLTQEWTVEFTLRDNLGNEIAHTSAPLNLTPSVLLKGLKGVAAHATDLASEFAITPVSYNVDSGPSGFSVDGSGIVTWTPTGTGSDTEYAVVTATDSGSATETITISLYSTDAPVPVLIAGQSQANEHENVAEAATYANVYNWNGSAAEAATSPLGANTENSTAMPGAWAELYDADHPNEVLLLVHTAVGGTGFNSSSGWDTGDLRYNNAVTKMNNALAAFPNASPVGIIWGSHGGATSGLNKQQMIDTLEGFRDDISLAINASSDVVFVNGDIYNESDADRVTVNQAIRDGSLHIDRYAGVDWRTGLSDIGDNTHLNSASMTTAAARVYRATESLMNPTAPDAPTGASILPNEQFTPLWAYPTVVDGGDTFFEYDPFNGRVATLITIYYSIGGGAEQSETFTYVPEGKYTVAGWTAGDEVTYQITATNAEGEGPRSTAVTTTLLSGSVGFVADLGEISNITSGGSSFTLGTFSLASSGAVAGNLLLILASTRQSSNDNPTYASLTLNGTAADVHVQERSQATSNSGSEVSVIGRYLTAADISAGSVQVDITHTGSNFLRGIATGVIYENASNIVTQVMAAPDNASSSENVTLASDGATAFVHTATGTLLPTATFSTDQLGANGGFHDDNKHVVTAGFDDDTSTPRTAGVQTVSWSGWHDGGTNHEAGIVVGVE